MEGTGTMRATLDGNGRVFSGRVFSVCWNAIHLGRMLLLQDARGAQSREERRKDVCILRALKSVSVAGPDTDERLVTGDPVRDAVPGAALVLAQPELDRLMDLVNRVPWDTKDIEDVEDALDWLSAAGRVDV